MSSLTRTTGINQDRSHLSNIRTYAQKSKLAPCTSIGSSSIYIIVVEEWEKESGRQRRISSHKKTLPIRTSCM